MFLLAFKLLGNLLDQVNIVIGLARLAVAGITIVHILNKDRRKNESLRNATFVDVVLWFVGKEVVVVFGFGFNARRSSGNRLRTFNSDLVIWCSIIRS